MGVNEAILLAAGAGSRLRPFTDRVPKPLLTVGQRTVLDHNLNALRRAGVRRVFVNTHAHAAMIEDYLAAGDWGMEVLTRREATLTGPAGGAALFRDALRGSAVLIVSADAVHDIDLAALVAHHSARKSLLTVAVRAVADPGRFGVPTLGDYGRITAFVEKPRLASGQTRLVSCGIYCSDRSLLDAVDCAAVTDFGRDVIPALARNDQAVFAIETTRYWLDMGTPEAFRRANLDAALGLFDSRPTGQHGPAGWISETAQIHPSASVEGPVIIGERVVIERDVVVRGPAVIGDDSFVARASHIHEAVLLPGAQIAAGAKLIRCVAA